MNCDWQHIFEDGGIGAVIGGIIIWVWNWYRTRGRAPTKSQYEK